MKKVLRFILILIIILLVGYLILCISSPKEIDIEKTTTIEAPADLVWSQVGSFDHWDKWSPWIEADSTVIAKNSGPSGEVGNKYEWTSEKSGSGEMIITSTQGYNMMYDMHFIEPFEGNAKGRMIVEPTDSGTKVIWGYHSVSSFIMRGVWALAGEKMLGAQLERGLELLKERIENGEVSMTYEVKASTFPATIYATVRQTVSMDSLMSAFTINKEKLDAVVEDKVNGNFSGIFYDWNPETNMTDFAVAYPVNEKVDGAEIIEIPESNCYMIKYTGDYSLSEKMHMQLEEHAQKAGKEITYKIEEYEQGPFNQPDANKYVTTIYYLTK